jgi:hypothetical protein
MAEHRIVILAGHPRAGKDTISRHWQRQWGFTEIHPGNMIRQWAGANDWPLNRRPDFVQARAQMIQEDPNVFLRPIIENPAQRICVNGLRVVRETQILQSEYDAQVLALLCDPWRRYQRALAASDDLGKLPASYRDFLGQENAESHSDDADGAATQTIIDMANATINTGVSEPLMLIRADAYLIDSGVLS